MRLPPLTLGWKLGLALLACLLVTAGNLLVTTAFYDSLSGATRIVNESGRLRYLSQKIAYLATRLEPGDRTELGRQVADYSATLAALHGALEAGGPARAIETPELHREIAAIENQWRAYRNAVETIRNSTLADAQARVALAFLHAAADQMLGQADLIVELLVDAEARVRNRVHVQLAAAFAVESLLLLGIFLFMRHGVSRPLRRLAGLCRRFATGDYSMRMPVRSRDEVGELAESFNRASEMTAGLVRDLNKRTRESTLLHRLAKLIQAEGHASARVLQQAASLLPGAWQHAEVAVARIAYGESAYLSPGFQATPWRQKAEFRCSEGLPMTLEVHYLELRPTADDGPFLAEERSLLDAVAEMLQFYIDDMNARRSQARLYSILEEATDPVCTFAADGTLLYLNHAAKAATGLAPDPGRPCNITDLYPEWVRTIHARAALPQAEKRGAWSGDVAVLGADGREIPMSQTITAHKALDGKVSYYSTILHDIGDRIRMEERLTQSRDFYLSLFHDFPDPIWRFDLAGRADYFNHAWLAFTGLPLEQQIDHGWTAALHPHDAAASLAALESTFASGARLDVEFRLRRRDGEFRWFLSHGSPYNDLDGEPAGFVGTCYDITDRKRAEAALLESQEELRTLFQAVEQSGNSIVVTDVRGMIEYVNPYFCKVTGYAAEEAVGRNPRILKSGNKSDEEYRQLWQTITSGQEWRGEFLDRTKDGRLYWESAVISPVRNTSGDIAHFVAVKEDITERKRIERELEQIANYDGLTGLPNRNLLTDRMNQALAFARRQRQRAAVLFLDLDRFKNINDTLGHGIGDRLLVVVAERLRAGLREGDTVARLGGDEFVVVLPDVGDEEDIDAVARKLLESLTRPFQIDAHELFASASLGISLYPRDGEDIQTLLKNADTAMYRAKEEGRNNYQFYAVEMNARSLERLALDASLRRALERNEFQLHYQPQVDLASGRIAGMEALIRWQHPEWGLISPARFIPVAEETGMIVPIGEWALRTACAQAKEWQDSGLPPLRVAVNLSARQFRQNRIAETVESILAETGLEGKYLNLELTESMLMLDPDHVIRVLGEIRRSGVRFSLDDFGTGYSSLGYLKRFPIDEVKIDQGFVREITRNPEDAAIARAIIAIAHSLRLKVVAEGVETAGQLNFLRRHHCNEIQGYFFSRPLPPADFACLLEGGRFPLPGDDARPQRTLLIVDDEPGGVAALQHTLRLENYRIVTAATPGEGLDILAGNDVHVLISDQRMPDMPGSEFLARARELSPDTVRIVLTGCADLGAVTDAINMGAVYKYLTKPWDNDELREQLREAFRHHETAREAPAQ